MQLSSVVFHGNLVFMNNRINTILSCFLIPSLGFGNAFGGEMMPFEATLLSSKEPIRFFDGAAETELMICWKFKNTTDELSRVRVRELGRPIVTGPDGQAVKVEHCPVDMFKRYEISDYPVIYPNQTLFFPFVIRILKRKSFGDWIILGDSPNWGDGYMFSPKTKGEYKIRMKYNSKKDNPENTTGALEEKSVGNAGFGISNYWEGEFVSNEISVKIE